MSLGVRPAILKAVWADFSAAVVVNSTRCATSQEVWPWPKPKMGTAFLRFSWRARCALIITTAAAPSETKQQSSRRRGAAIKRDSRYCSKLKGLRNWALGF